MDPSSFDQYFDKLQVTRSQSAAEMTVKILETLADDTVEAKELDETYEAIKTFGDEKSINKEVKAYRLKGKKQEDTFLEMIIQILSGMEKYLIEKEYDALTKLSDPATVKYMRVKIHNCESNKKDFVLVTENSEKSEFKVHMKNLYESHGN